MAVASSHVRAWTFDHHGYPAAIKQSTTAVKDTLAPTELRIDIKAAALNPVDIQLMNFPIWPYLPTSIAHPTHGLAEDFSGIVTAAGESSGYKPGDAVFGMVPILSTGTLQTTIVTDSRAACLALKPAGWSHAQAAALPLVYLTARTVVERAATANANAHDIKRVVVLGGSSATGMWMVHLAARRGWHVTATCSGRNVEFVRSMGADHVIDYTAINGGSLADAVRAARPDAVLDCVGGTECLGIANVYVTIVGDKTSRANMGGANTYYWNPQMVLRSWLGRLGLGKAYECVNLDMKREYLEETLRLDPGKITVDSTFAFDDVKAAFERMDTGRARGKVVVTVDASSSLGER